MVLDAIRWTKARSWCNWWLVRYHEAPVILRNMMFSNRCIIWILFLVADPTFKLAISWNGASKMHLLESKFELVSLFLDISSPIQLGDNGCSQPTVLVHCWRKLVLIREDEVQSRLGLSSKCFVGFSIQRPIGRFCWRLHAICQLLQYCLRTARV